MMLLVNAAIFQIAWFLSVIGGAQHMPWLGPVAVIVAVVVHLRFARNPFEEMLLILGNETGWRFACGSPKNP